MQLLNEIIVDSFAGGGGVSVGIEMATGRHVDIAINHDPAAIAMHKVNHPNTKHYIEDIWKVDPVEAVAGRPVGLAWFSPDCKHHSKARGGKPRDNKIRGLAWVAVKWAKLVHPRVIILENVEEFQGWGPLSEDGQPVIEKKGETFELFKKALKRHGYKVEHRELRACDFGAPTIRKRFFLIARCDGKPIKWPEPTHGNPETLEVKSGLLKPWRTAAEIIDWSIPCKSIFDRKKSLAENTMRRVAKGIDKFVINTPEPFIVQVNHSGANHHYCRDINDPLSTITSKHGFGIVTPILSQIGQTGGGDRLHDIQDPLSTIVSKQEHMLVTPTLIQVGYGEREGQEPRALDINKPLGTIVSTGKHALIAPMLIQYHTETTSSGVRGQAIDEPIMTVDSSPRYALAVANLCVLRNNMDAKSLNNPLSTITAGAGHFAEQATFLTKYYGQGIGQGVDVPIDTVVSKDRFGLISVKIAKVDSSNNLGHWSKVRAMLNEYCGYKIAEDEVLLLCINGIYYFIFDIGLRMLTPRELFNAQGFPEDYIIDHDDEGNPYPQYAQVARCGNAVPPQLPKALVQANLPELCGIEPIERGQIS